MSEINIQLLSNKGTGAGGANTNYYGKKFEEKTNNQQRLLDLGYIKTSFTKNPKKAYDYYLIKTFETKTIIFVLQNGLKMYMKNIRKKRAKRRRLSRNKIMVWSLA
jgi:hypothetical protein